MNYLAITSTRLVTPDGVVPATIHVRDGLIAAVADYHDTPAGIEEIDAGDLVVMPGLVDAHVHVNEPGRTEWEGFSTATRAAAAGGVTTIVDMPLNSIPPTTTVDGLKAKIESATGKCAVDVAFWGGVVPGNTAELAPLLGAGVRGFKCFLIHSGVDEFPNVTEGDLRIAMTRLAELGAVLLVHAELPAPIDAALSLLAQDNAKEFKTFLKSRPREAENQAIALMISLCRDTRARVHIVHHSSSDALPMLQRARDEGLPITVETCPHYLTFAAEDIPEAATEFKCCPPVRESENREKLWEALASGVIDMIVSDHSPCTPHLKLREEGDFMQAWGGIASLQFGLSVVWTGLCQRAFSFHHLAEWMSRRPAQLAGLGDRKGQLKKGFDADIVIWNPESDFTVRPEIIQHRHKMTPYNGRTLKGVVEAVYLRGDPIFVGGQFSAKRTGQLILT